MKKYLIILFSLILIIPIFINGDEYDSVVYKKFYFDDLNNLSDNVFYKIDSEGNIINDAEFIIRDLNNKFQYDNINYDSSIKAYKYNSIISRDYNEIFNFIPSSVKDTVNGFQKMDDFFPYAKQPALEASELKYIGMEVVCKKEYWENDLLNSSVTEKYPIMKLESPYYYKNCVVTIPVLTVLEEIKTPKGLEKATKIIPSTAMIKYDFDIPTGNISGVDAVLINRDALSQFIHYFMIDYDSSANYDDSVNYLNSIIYNDEIISPLTCENYSLINLDELDESFNISEETKEKIRSIQKFFEKNSGSSTEISNDCYPILIDASGHSDISIESYVNNVEEVNLTQSDTVQIKVFLKNSGSAPSYDNVVVSEVPEGVEYVEGSANAGGVYNPDDRTVTWNLDYLDAHDGYIFAYDVSVTAGQSSNIYVTTSSVTSNENTTPIESNEARVTTPGMGSEDIPENPKTGDERMFVIILGLLIGFTIMFYVRSKRIVKL